MLPLAQLIPEQPDELLDAATQSWHENASVSSEAFAGESLLALHRANFELWHLEDEARDPAAPDARIAACKRAIDAANQRRNDLMEDLDRLLLSEVPQEPSAPLHSETPGQMLDRVSILSLKIYHTREEAERESASQAHRERNRQRLLVLMEQRSDLLHALGRLSQEIADGTRRFRLYQQMKMYNDPALNPVLYRQAGASANSA